MADIVEEITFQQGTGLDWDSDKRAVGKGDSRYRLNIVPNEFGNEYVLTNMKGTTKYSHAYSHGSDYSGAVYQCVGDCYDDNRDAVYYFIASSMGNDCILRFNFSDHSFDKIVWDHTGIDLSPDYPITDAFMIGNWLHFNPRTSSPRAINVQWAYYDFVSYGVAIIGGGNRAIGDYVRYGQKIYRCTQVIADDENPINNPDSYEFVDYHYDDVWPLEATGIDPQPSGEYHRYRDFYNIPTILPYSPLAAVVTDSDYEYNNIRGRRFQFCYRHYVPDQGYTVTSSFTDVIYPPSAETNKGEVIGSVQEYNKITVTIPLGHIATGAALRVAWDYLFEFVELLFREGPDDDWKLAERILHDAADVTFDGSYNIYTDVDFFNDRAYETIDSVEVEKQFNWLPKLANSQWSLDGERSAYGGITEGFNLSVNIDVGFTVQEDELTLDIDDTNAKDDYTFGDPTYDPGWGKWLYTTTENISQNNGGDPVLAGDVIRCTVGGNDYYRVLVAIDDDGDNEYADAYIALLTLKAGLWAYRSAGPKINIISDAPVCPVTDSKIYCFEDTSTSNLARKYKSFKSGAWHPFCLYYYDDSLRRSEPVFDPSMRVYVETLPEVLGPNESTNYKRYIDWSISHSPPSWARYWRWGYAGNQTIEKFWQYNIESLTIETKPVGSDTWTKIDISPLQKIADAASGYDHYFPNTTIDAYSYVAGDRVRFIANHSEEATDYSNLNIMDDNYDYEIKYFDSTNNYIYIDTLTGPATSTTTSTTPPDETYIIEIYRPKQQTGTTVYYEYGSLYTTYYDGGVLYHRGASQNQTDAQDAEGQFTGGDVYVITRLFSKSPFAEVDNPVFIESASYSDFYDTDGWGKGKAGAFTGIGEKYVNNIRFSNKYSPTTSTSGLSTFDPLDFKEMSNDHGNIIAMRQAGHTLKVYFERNSASVLVNKQLLYDADGQSQVVKSDDVLGTAAYSNYHFGTIFPESVILKDRTVFFYDIYRDAYIQDSPNGLVPISDLKMRKYFNDKSSALLTSGVSNVKVYSAYDFDHDMLYVHFVDEYDSTNDEVILFHEPSNRWVTFLQVSSNIREVSTTTTTSTSSTSSSSSSTSSTSSSSTLTTEESLETGIIFGHGAMQLLSYVGEDVYIHNSNTTRNNFWGTQRNSIVEFISNEGANWKKTYEAMAIHSNKPWRVGYVAIESDSTYSSGMQSKIPESRFKLREGIYFANYLRNMKTYSSTASNLDLIRGEQLRGYMAEHRMINDDTTEVKLFKVDVFSNVSRI